MARKIFVEEQPVDLMSHYLTKKLQYDQLKKEVENLAKQVKANMVEKEQKFVECNGYKITKSVSQKINWDEKALLERVKTYNKPELIETVEQVNLETLQQSIIDGEVDINELQDCQTTTETVRLLVTKIKESKENE